MGLVLASIVGLCAGCRNERQLKEIQRVRTGDMDVVLLSGDGTLHQKDPFTIEFRSGSSANLIDVGAVTADATMPMPGMAPMFGNVRVRAAEVKGRYVATGGFDMAGGWRIALRWDGPGGKGSISFPGTVQ